MQQQYTEEIETTPPGPLRADPRRMVLLSIMVLILSFIGRVAYLAFTAGPQQEGEILATLPVGPEGGSAKFAGRGELRVPKGALAKKQTLTVRRAPIRDRIRALSPFGGSPIIVPAGTQIIYLFGPVDVRFLRPVTIVLPAPPPPQRGLIFVFSNGQLRFLDAAGSRTVTIRVNSFDFSQRSSFVS
jgi:hypothetical protein